jgi:hypothetical protein
VHDLREVVSDAHSEILVAPIRDVIDDAHGCFENRAVERRGGEIAPGVEAERRSDSGRPNLRRLA